MLSRLTRGFSALTSIEEYSKAMDYIQVGNTGMAEIELKRSLEILQNARVTGPDYSQLLTHLAIVSRHQKKVQAAENYLEKSVQNCKDSQSPPAHLANSYVLLLQQYLESNVDKAIRQCIFIDQRVDSEIFSIAQKSALKFYSGTALLLNGVHYSGAKDDLKKAQELDSGSMSGMVAHNLAWAEWWTKEYEHAIDGFQISIQLLENLDQLYTADDSASKISSPEAGRVLTNIAEVYAEQVDDETSMKWLKTAMKTCVDHPETIARALTLIGAEMRKQEKPMHSEGLLRSARDMLKDAGTYDESRVLEEFGTLWEGLKNREREGEEHKEQAKEISSKLPYWAYRQSKILLPQWTISPQIQN